MLNKYDKMDYNSFINHLKENNIEYMEDVFSAERYKVVIPVKSKLKERYFGDDGSQLLR